MRVAAKNRRMLGLPAIVSALLVLPFMILELINRPGFPARFPFVLFGLMWVLSTAFIFVLMSVLQKVRTEDRRAANLPRLLPRLVFLALVAWFWIGLVDDQMPCFLGVPNCD